MKILGFLDLKERENIHIQIENYYPADIKYQPNN